MIDWNSGIVEEGVGLWKELGVAVGASVGVDVVGGVAEAGWLVEVFAVEVCVGAVVSVGVTVGAGVGVESVRLSELGSELELP